MVSSRWAVIGARPLLRLINSVTVQTSLTRERYKLGTATKELERKGKCDLYRGLAMAQVGVCGAGNAHRCVRRQSHRQRPQAHEVFSPVSWLTSRLATLLTKDEIVVDILSFGEMEQNHAILSEFISKVNFDGNSHLYEVSSFQSFNDILIPGGDNGIFADAA